MPFGPKRSYSARKCICHLAITRSMYLHLCICSLLLSNSARACSSLSSVGRCRLCQVDPAQDERGRGRGSLRANLLRYLFVFFWAHTSCAHRRPIGPPLRPRLLGGSQDKWPDTIVSLFECYLSCSSHLLRHLRICTLFALFAFALRFISLFLLPKTSNNLRAKS